MDGFDLAKLPPHVLQWALHKMTFESLATLQKTSNFGKEATSILVSDFEEKGILFRAKNHLDQLLPPLSVEQFSPVEKRITSQECRKNIEAVLKSAESMLTSHFPLVVNHYKGVIVHCKECIKYLDLLASL